MDIETDDSSTDEDRPFIKSKTGEFTYLDADEELLEPFERLGWFSGRPNYYFAENIFIWVSKFQGSTGQPQTVPGSANQILGVPGLLIFGGRTE